jgi:hypothetical protein
MPAFCSSRGQAFSRKEARNRRMVQASFGTRVRVLLCAPDRVGAAVLSFGVAVGPMLGLARGRAVSRKEARNQRMVRVSFGARVRVLLLCAPGRVGAACNFEFGCCGSPSK